MKPTNRKQDSVNAVGLDAAGLAGRSEPLLGRRSFRRRGRFGAALPAAALAGVFSLIASSALAKTSATAIAEAGGGQPALAVGFDDAGKLRARVCTGTPCSIGDGEVIEVGAEVRGRKQQAQLLVVKLEAGRRAIVVRIDDPRQDRVWQSVIVAPLAGQKPSVLFNGWTGLAEGEYGLRSGGMVIISEADPEGARRIVVGEQREDLTICGRPTVIAPQVLNPTDLKLRPAKMQRLGVEERKTAPRVVARRVTAEETNSNYPLLKAIGASSALGDPAALTDGNPETAWVENRGGAGRGEFVVMNMPSKLGLVGFDVMVRSATSKPQQGAAPKEFWLATHKQLVHVSLPEDAFQHPGARYRVELEEPLRGDCLALVLESGFDESSNARISVAELSARTEFEQSSLEALVGALAGGGRRSDAAKAVLASMGEPAFAAASAKFESMDEGGKRVTLELLDQAPCSTSAPTYIKAMLGPFEGQQIHGRDRLRRCGTDSADALAKALHQVKAPQKGVVAAELGLLAPVRAVSEIVPLLSGGDAAVRGQLRKALAVASHSDEAEKAVRAVLGDSAGSPRGQLEVLRALGERVAAFQPEASSAFDRLAQPGASFETRYLLLGPAAELSPTHAPARRYLADALSRDANPHLRWGAAQAISDPALFQKELLRATADPEVRVREASVTVLGEHRAKFGTGALVERLQEDDWPLVRIAAAKAAAGLGPDPRLDQALAESLEDDSAAVRAPAALALGARRAFKHVPDLRDRLEDDDEDPNVRGAVALSLGMLCDSGSVDLLTELALKIADPFASEAAKTMAPRALRALGRIRPPDLRERLAPLLGEGSPPSTQAAARAALKLAPSCGFPNTRAAR